MTALDPSYPCWNRQQSLESLQYKYTNNLLSSGQSSDNAHCSKATLTAAQTMYKFNRQAIKLSAAFEPDPIDLTCKIK